MKNVKISHQYLLAYGTLYRETELNLQQSLQSLPRKAALELMSFALHNLNLRKRSDNRFQSNQLFSWMMQIDKNEQLLIIEFAQKENVLISDSSFQFLDRKACLHLIQHILVYSVEKDTELEAKDHSTLFKCLLYFNTIVNAEQENIFNWDGCSFDAGRICCRNRSIVFSVRCPRHLFLSAITWLWINALLCT